MRKAISLILIGILPILVLPRYAHALMSQTSATVPNKTVTLSGYQSKHASMVITNEKGELVASSTTDSKAYFYISNSAVSISLSKICIHVIDFKRIGQSTTCLSTDGLKSNYITFNNILLPPTIAVSKKQLQSGQIAQIYGYTMPNARVYLSINNKRQSLSANAEGYYAYDFTEIEAGRYNISAISELNNRTSLASITKASVEVLPPTTFFSRLQSINNPAQSDNMIFFIYLASLILGFISLFYGLYRLLASKRLKRKRQKRS